MAIHQIQNNRGQAALEAVVASMGIFFFVLLLLFLFYVYSVQTFLQYSSHEFLLCREISNPFSCQKKFEKELQSTLRFGDFKILQAQKVGSSQKLHLRIRFPVLNLKTFIWHYKDQVQFPLKARL